MDSEPILPQPEPVIPPSILPAKKFNPILILAAVILLVVVGVGGILLGKSLNPPSESASPAIVPISTSTPDITANWRTYINNDYGDFELKYPDDYLLREAFIKPKTGEFSLVHSLSLVKKANKNIGQPPSITLDIVTSKKTVQEYIDYDQGNELAEFQSWEQVSGLKSAEPRIISTSQVQGKGIVATKIERQRMDTAPHSKQNQYIFENNGFIYVLSVNYGTYNPDTREDGSDERNTLDIIFSTFKFSNSSQADETSNWKTYINDFAKFSLRYPDSINYSEKSFSDKEKQVIFVGNAGKLTINLAAWGWSAGWGGGCEEKDKGIITVGETPKQACVGETSFHQIYLNNPGIAYLNIYSEFKPPYKETILRVLSTFKFD